MSANRSSAISIVTAAAVLCLNCHSWQLASQPIQEVVPADSVTGGDGLEVRAYLSDGGCVDLDRPRITDGRLHGATKRGDVWDVSLDSVSKFKIRRFDTTGTVLLAASAGLFVLLGTQMDCCGPEGNVLSGRRPEF